MVKYKIATTRKSGARAIRTHENLVEARRNAKEMANTYNKAYYIYKYHPGKPMRNQYPYWTYVETIFPSKKKRRKK